MVYFFHKNDTLVLFFYDSGVYFYDLYQTMCVFSRFYHIWYQTPPFTGNLTTDSVPIPFSLESVIPYSSPK